MRCKNYSILISDAIDDRLDPNIRKKLDIHLDECKSCREYYRELQKILPLLKGLPRYSVPVDFAKQVQKRIDEQQVYRSTFSRPRNYLRWSLRLAALLLIGFTIWLWIAVGKFSKENYLLLPRSDTDRKSRLLTIEEKSTGQDTLSASKTSQTSIAMSESGQPLSKYEKREATAETLPEHIHIPKSKSSSESPLEVVTRESLEGDELSKSSPLVRMHRKKCEYPGKEEPLLEGFKKSVRYEKLDKATLSKQLLEEKGKNLPEHFDSVPIEKLTELANIDSLQKEHIRILLLQSKSSRTVFLSNAISFIKMDKTDKDKRHDLLRVKERHSNIFITVGMKKPAEDLTLIQSWIQKPFQKFFIIWEGKKHRVWVFQNTLSWEESARILSLFSHSFEVLTTEVQSESFPHGESKPSTAAVPIQILAILLSNQDEQDYQG